MQRYLKVLWKIAVIANVSVAFMCHAFKMKKEMECATPKSNCKCGGKREVYLRNDAGLLGKIRKTQEKQVTP